MTTNKRFLFVDLEATGLSENAGLLEIYAVLTNHRFKPRNTLHLVCGQPIRHYSQDIVWDEDALEMHSNNGLISEMKEIGCLNANYYQVQKALYFWLDSLPGKAADRYLAGSSVHGDRQFLSKMGLPIDSYVSHRHFDVSVFKAMDLISGTKLLEEKKVTDHRARTDVLIDIAVAQQVQKLWKSLTLTPDPDDGKVQS